MMSRKHYRAIAEIIKQEYDNYDGPTGPGICGGVLEDIAGNLVDYFKQDNPNFDRQKFLDACGITD